MKFEQSKNVRNDCTWSENEEGSYDTSCGNCFVITDGSPLDNKMHFCCYCGKSLREQKYKVSTEIDDIVGT